MSISQYPNSAALHRRKRLEILVPSVLLILSLGVVGVLTYRLLQGSDSQTKTAYIPQGRQVYHIFQGDSCIGSLESITEEGKLLQWRVFGSLRLEDQGNLELAEISLESFFNPLHQLFQSMLKIEYGDMSLKIHLENVHPIDIDLSAQTGAFSFARRFRLPGPIVFEPTRMPLGGGSEPEAALNHNLAELIPAYMLRYHYLSGLLPQPAERSSEQLLNSLQLRIINAPRVEGASDSSVIGCEAPGTLRVDQIRQALLSISPLVLQDSLKNMEGLRLSEERDQEQSGEDENLQAPAVREQEEN